MRARFEKEAGKAPEASLDRFMQGNPVDLSNWVSGRPNLGPILDWIDERRYLTIDPDEAAAVATMMMRDQQRLSA